MSEATHTPGPWFVGEHDNSGQRMVRSDHIEVSTCWHHSVGAIEKEMEANARLIAAAPDMLEALKAVLEEIDNTFPFDSLPGIKAAIKKAEGTS